MVISTFSELRRSPWVKVTTVGDSAGSADSAGMSPKSFVMRSLSRSISVSSGLLGAGLSDGVVSVSPSLLDLMFLLFCLTGFFSDISKCLKMVGYDGD